MEKFREIEIDLQNKINEIIGIDTLFDDYVKDRNEYDKELFNSLLNNNAKLSNKINKATEHLEESIYDYLKEDKDLDGSYNVMTCKTFKERYLIPVLKILKGEENE